MFGNRLESLKRWRVGGIGAIVALTLLIGSLPLTGCGNRKQRFRETIAAAEKVHLGMTTDEVIALLGDPIEQDEHSLRNSDKVKKILFTYRSPENWMRFLTERYRPYVFVSFENERVCRVSINPDEDMPFDSAEWKRSTWDRRGCMVRDLLKTISFKGKTKTEVAALLGPGEDSWAPKGSPPPN